MRVLPVPPAYRKPMNAEPPECEVKEKDTPARPFCERIAGCRTWVTRNKRGLVGDALLVLIREVKVRKSSGVRAKCRITYS